LPCWSLGALLELMSKEGVEPFIDSNPFVGYGDGQYRCVYLNGDWESSHQTTGNTLIEAAYNMVCWLLENDYIKNENKMEGYKQKKVEGIISELEWSEDEMIKKKLKALVTWAKSYSASGITWGDAETILNWLEKQSNENYNPYKTTVESISAMVEKYAPFGSDLQDFYDNVKVKCKDAVEYDKTFLENQSMQEQLYIRFGEIPTDEKSKIYQGDIEVGTENGVSVYPAFKTDEGDVVLGLSLPITKTTLYTQQHLIEYDDRPCYLVKGDYVGKDTDGQPLINNISIIEKIDKYRINEEKQDKQNPADEVKPKFKVGDCIRHKGSDECYRIVTIDDNFYFCENKHAWAIRTQDYFELVEQKPTECNFPYGVNETVDKLIAIAECLEMDGDCLFNGHTGTECGKFLRDLARKQVECKPTEWNEEDKTRLKVIKEELERLIMFNQYGTALSVDDIDWLKNLPERFNLQPKQEWSEHEENLFDLLKACVCHYYINDPHLEYSKREKVSKEIVPFIEMLKSLTPQPHWKPSDEQMRAVFEASERNDKLGSVLLTLYNDLKKLWS